MSEFAPDGAEATVIDRSTTGKRILFTVVFLLSPDSLKPCWPSWFCISWSIH